MNKTNSKITIKWILAFVPLCIVVIFYNKIPNQIPIHWNLNGSVTYGSQLNLWINASMSVIFAILFPILRRIDPRGKNYDKFGKYYDEFQIFMMLFFIAITSIMVSESINPGEINVEKVIVILVGVLFTIIGNMMPKFKNNFFVGIKTPWTISSENVWNKTHRIGGIMWFFGGLLIIGAGILLKGTAIFVSVLIITCIITIVPIVMSYFWYKENVKG